MKCFDLLVSTWPATQEANFDIYVKNRQKSTMKHSIEKPILLNFVNLSTIFCPRLWYNSNLKKKKKILNNRKITTTFNDYFEEIILSLNLFKWPGNVTSLADNLAIVDNIVLKF